MQQTQMAQPVPSLQNMMIECQIHGRVNAAQALVSQCQLCQTFSSTLAASLSRASQVQYTQQAMPQAMPQGMTPAMAPPQSNCADCATGTYRCMFEFLPGACCCG